MKYIGKGAFLVGVPSRDLTDDEVQQHGGAIRLIASGLYEREQATTTAEAAPVKPIRSKKLKPVVLNDQVTDITQGDEIVE